VKRHAIIDGASGKRRFFLLAAGLACLLWGLAAWAMDRLPLTLPDGTDSHAITA
jgi:hypothetical protein